MAYPGISANRFNPLEAGRVWAECIKVEKDAGYVHRTLDGAGKLGLPRAWAQDKSRRDGLLPSYESLDEVYYMTGWKKNKVGATQQPDIRHLIPALRPAKKDKKPRRIFDDDLRHHDPFAEEVAGRPPSSALSLSSSHRSLKTPLRRQLKSHNASAPSLPATPAPAPPDGPPSATSRQYTAPPTPAYSAVSRRTASAAGLPGLGPRSELSTARSNRTGRTGRSSVVSQKIAELVSSEVNSQCSQWLDK